MQYSDGNGKHYFSDHGLFFKLQFWGQISPKLSRIRNALIVTKPIEKSKFRTILWATLSKKIISCFKISHQGYSCTFLGQNVGDACDAIAGGNGGALWGKAGTRRNPDEQTSSSEKNIGSPQPQYFSLSQENNVERKKFQAFVFLTKLKKYNIAPWPVYLFFSSVRSSSVYQGLIEIRSSKPLFQIFRF